MSIFNRYLEKSTQDKDEKSHPLVIITGYYGFDNLGDEAILEELLNELSSFCPRQNIVVLSNNPKKTASLYKVQSVDRWNFFIYQNLLRQAKLLISGGGGLFQDRTGLRSVIYYSAQIFLAKFFAVPVLIYAQGLGPLQKALTRKLTEMAYRLADVITVRDYSSLAIVKAWGFNCQLTADPVWALPSSALPTVAKQLIETIKSKASTSSEGRGMLVGLSLRNDPKLKDDHLQLLANIISSVLPPRSTILLLPLQESQDVLLLKKIEQHFLRLGITTHMFDPAALTKPSQWLDLMDYLDFVIGMRLHALLMALRMGKPVIGIAYDKKVNLLLSEFQQPLLFLNDMDVQTLETVWSTTIVQAFQGQEKLIRLINNKLIAIRQLAFENAKILAKCLPNNRNLAN